MNKALYIVFQVLISLVWFKS